MRSAHFVWEDAIAADATTTVTVTVTVTSGTAATGESDATTTTTVTDGTEQHRLAATRHSLQICADLLNSSLLVHE